MASQALRERVRTEQFERGPLHIQSAPTSLSFEAKLAESWQNRHTSFTANAAEFRPDFPSLDSKNKQTRLNTDAVSFIPSTFQPAPKKPEPDLDSLKRGLDLNELCQPDPAESAEFALPASYLCEKPVLKPSQFQRFSSETMLYIFYNMPCDNLQSQAAADLCRRGWSFDTVSKMWYTTEHGTLKRFDTQAWQMKEVSKMPATLLSKEAISTKRS